MKVWAVVTIQAGFHVQAVQSGKEKILFLLLQEDLIVAADWGQCLERGVANSPEKVDFPDVLGTVVVAENLKEGLV
jgi:hypothetical protein